MKRLLLAASVTVAVVLAAAGCQTDPCHAHGGTKFSTDTANVWLYHCNDGTTV